MAKISDVLDKLERQNPDIRKEYSDEQKARIKANLAESIEKLREAPKLLANQIRDTLSYTPPKLDALFRSHYQNNQIQLVIYLI